MERLHIYIYVILYMYVYKYILCIKTKEFQDVDTQFPSKRIEKPLANIEGSSRGYESHAIGLFVRNPLSKPANR